MSSYKITGGHHHGRSQIADFICPDNGYRGLQKRQGINPKDHMKENRLMLRQAQAKMREDREEAARVPKDLYKLQQFRDIKPRLYDISNKGASRSGGGGVGLSTMSRGSSNSRADHDDYGDEENQEDGNYDLGYENDSNDNCGNVAFVRKGMDAKRREDLKLMNLEARKELEAKMEDARWIADRPETPRKGPTPKSSEVAKLAPRSNADFISRNRAKALTLMPPKLSDKSSTTDLHEEFGKVPEYLEERKAKWAKEKEELKKRMPDPSCPKGMTLMPEEERLSTLEVLKASKEEATKQLAKMPFVIETPTLKKRHSELEAKLREIENAIALFSKTKVYIALDR
jgi:hypothetical protein